MIATVAIRFALYADTSAGEHGCWPWTGTRNEFGYGVLHRPGRHSGIERAHRLALILNGVELPESAHVCHTCDNPPCVNPAHLYVGDAKSNAADRMEHGRHNAGAANGQAKLTEDEVREIRVLRRQGWTLAALAGRFDVGVATVHRVVKRQGWQHVT